MYTNYQNNISFNQTIFHMDARLPSEGRVREWSHFLLRAKAVLLLWIIYVISVFFFVMLSCTSVFLCLMPRSHIHGSPRRFQYVSKPTDDPGNDNFRCPIRMHNASTTTYDYGLNTEIYGLIRIATYDAGSYPWLLPRQIRECVTWALRSPAGKWLTFYAQVTHSRIGRRIRHGYDPASFVGIRIGP